MSFWHLLNVFTEREIFNELLQKKRPDFIEWTILLIEQINLTIEQTRYKMKANKFKTEMCRQKTTEMGHQKTTERGH